MKTTKTVLFASLIATMMVPIGVNESFASHPLPTFYPFSSANKSICYQMTQLDSVKINGITGQSALIKTELEKSRVHVSDNTDINISFDSVCNSGDNETRGKYFSSSYMHADTVVYNAGLSTQYKWISYTTNTSHNFVNSGFCNFGQSPNINYVGNHEFGHFAGINHAPSTDSDSHTMMKPDCTPGYAIIRTADINQINGMY